MSNSKEDEQYGKHEAAQRRDAIVRAMIATPPTPQKPLNKQPAKKTTKAKKA